MSILLTTRGVAPVGHYKESRFKAFPFQTWTICPSLHKSVGSDGDQTVVLGLIQIASSSKKKFSVIKFCSYKLYPVYLGLKHTSKPLRTHAGGIYFQIVVCAVFPQTSITEVRGKKESGWQQTAWSSLQIIFHCSDVFRHLAAQRIGPELNRSSLSLTFPFLGFTDQKLISTAAAGLNCSYHHRSHTDLLINQFVKITWRGTESLWSLILDTNVPALNQFCSCLTRL